MSTMAPLQDLESAINWMGRVLDWCYNICPSEGNPFYTNRILTLKFRPSQCQETLPLHLKSLGKFEFVFHRGLSSLLRKVGCMYHSDIYLELWKIQLTGVILWSF